MSDLVVALLILFCAYALGSIPFGLLLTKLAGMGDIRAIGSGNIGATNVLRTGRKTLALLTLLLDIGKGAAAVIAAAIFIQVWFPTTASYGLWVGFAGLGAVLGHTFPVWLSFKGGKGVATALGVFLALAWPVGAACIATWLLTAALSRLSSLAALFAMALAPLFAYLWGTGEMLAFAAVIAALVIGKHHGNIRRLLKGEEPRIGSAA